MTIALLTIMLMATETDYKLDVRRTGSTSALEWNWGRNA